MPHFNRRKVIAILGALPSVALAQGRPPLSSIEVDVSHLRAIGAGPWAEVVRASMTDELRRLYAGQVGGRGGARLVVRVTVLHITAFAHGGRGFRGSVSDSIDGEVLLVGPRGEVLRRLPQLAAVPAHGTWYDPDDTARRTDRVARVYAQWIKQRLG